MKAKGRLSWNPKGFAFVVGGSGPDIFIPGSDLNSAMDGDLVEVEAFRDRKGLRGRVVSILERGTLALGGTYWKYKKWGILEPNSPFPYTIIIPHGSEDSAQSGDTVMVKIEPPKQKKRVDAVVARVMHSLNIPQDIGDDLKSVATKHGLPWLFPPAVEEEACKEAEIDMQVECARRRDLRDRILFTLDGVSARDFDDAVGIAEWSNGTYLMTVAIADVAHLVKNGALLDKEAFNRSFSVYFPEACIPMLPEVLSNGVCSLKPHEDRLAMVVEMRLGPRGKLLSYDCYEAVIRSHARLTYEAVSPYLAGHAQPPVAAAEVLQTLETLHHITGYLYARRRQRGSLDFDLPEIDIGLNSEGLVESVYRRQRGPGERLIEEAMLLANQVVCQYLKDRDLPILYRVHEAPSTDDLFDLLQTLQDIGLEKILLSRLRSAITSGMGLNRALQAVADVFQDDPRESFVHQHILRSLRQAKYQSEDVGHFGLACKGYLHFTSPIRRYPDLIIHRILKTSFRPEGASKKAYSKWERYLKFIGPEVSRKERVTNEAMFDVIKLKTAAYMAQHIGEEFPGIVSSILPFGMFVQIADPPVDGLVSLSELGHTKIVEDRHVRLRKRTISLGDIVAVRITRVDPVRGLIDLSLL